MLHYLTTQFNRINKIQVQKHSKILHFNCIYIKIIQKNSQDKNQFY